MPDARQDAFADLDHGQAALGPSDALNFELGGSSVLDLLVIRNHRNEAEWKH
jgi:hypothetical protein